MAEQRKSRRKSRVGRVCSDAMDKTAVVRIETLVKHPMYQKYIRRRRNLKVHDPENQARIGDLVRVTETRPLSKTKRWRLENILEKAK